MCATVTRQGKIINTHPHTHTHHHRSTLTSFSRWATTATRLLRCCGASLATQSSMPSWGLWRSMARWWVLTLLHLHLPPLPPLRLLNLLCQPLCSRGIFYPRSHPRHQCIPPPSYPQERVLGAHQENVVGLKHASNKIEAIVHIHIFFTIYFSIDFFLPQTKNVPVGVGGWVGGCVSSNVVLVVCPAVTHLFYCVLHLGWGAASSSAASSSSSGASPSSSEIFPASTFMRQHALHISMFLP